MKDTPFTADRLLALYDRVAEAEDAIPRLRRFVLDLAVRGKLVEQDPSDEPAAELLKRIAKEKARLVKAGEIKAGKPSQPISDVPFQVAQSWSWVRLAELASYIQRGKSPQYATADGLPVVSQKCVQWSGLDLTVARQITVESLKNYEPIRFLRADDLLWNSTGTGTIGRLVRLDEIPENLVCDSHVTVVRCVIAEAEYVRIWLMSDHVYGLIEGKASGSTNQVELTAQMANAQPVPLPPLAEQRRIVAKVEELMALCDRLQAARAGCEAVRDRLTAATWARLTAPEIDAETFPTHARAALQILPTLTTRPAQIKTLRQTILNLAVRGKLAEQDPTDEPAAELLKRITEANRRIQKAKGIRGSNAAEAATGFEELGDVPSTWRRTHLQDIAYQITDGTHLTPRYTPTGKPFLSAQNVKPFRFMPDQYRFVSEQDFDGYRANRKPERGDVLLTRVGAGIGEAAVLDSDFEFAFYVSLCLIKVPLDLFLPEYLVIWLNSPEGRASSTSRTYGKGASQGNLNLSMIRTFEIPLPPLAEQHRIVARVDTLMALCDQLESSLTTATTTRSRLLEALLHEALDGALGVQSEAAA